MTFEAIGIQGEFIDISTCRSRNAPRRISYIIGASNTLALKEPQTVDEIRDLTLYR